jgi:hypothetical protein
LLGGLLFGDTRDVFNFLQSFHRVLAFRRLESGDQFLDFLYIFLGSLNAYLFDSFDDRVLNHLRSRRRREGRLHMSYCRSWSRGCSWYLTWLLIWHKNVGLNVEALGGKRWLLRGSHRLVRDRELSSIITCRRNVPVKGIALTTRLCSRLSCLSCDERSCSDGHGRRGRGETR